MRDIRDIVKVPFWTVDESPHYTDHGKFGFWGLWGGARTMGRERMGERVTDGVSISGDSAVH